MFVVVVCYLQFLTSLFMPIINSPQELATTLYINYNIMADINHEDDNSLGIQSDQNITNVVKVTVNK